MATMQMNLVFRLGEIGFVLPICHLLEIREGVQEWLDRGTADAEEEIIGEILLRGRGVPVWDLGKKIGLSPAGDQKVLTILILGKPEKPWGVAVDRIDGFFPGREFVVHELPLLLRREEQIYDSLDVWRGEPLIHCDPEKISPGWIGP